MRKFLIVMTVFLASAIAASCTPSRDAADKKLATACLGSVQALSGPEDLIDVQTTAFKSEKNQDGASLRTVRMHVNFVKDHGAIQEKDYTCAYKEQWTFFAYMAEFYSLEKDSDKYGNFDGHILGDVTDLMKINQATEKALY